MMLRPSSLSDYPDCPKRSIASTQPKLIQDAGFQLVKSTPGIASVIGISSHAVMDSTLKAKIRTGELGSLKQGLDYAMSVYEEETKEGVVWDAHASTDDQARFQITEIAYHYHTHVSPTLNPIHVEQELRGTIGEHEMVGHVDVIEPTRCRDKKTGIHKPISKPQMGAYSWLMKINGYDVTENPIIDWVPRKKSKYTMIEYDLNESVNSAKNIIDRMIRDIDEFEQTGDPSVFMANPHSSMCLEKLCPAYGTDFCKEWK